MLLDIYEDVLNWTSVRGLPKDGKLWNDVRKFYSEELECGDDEDSLRRALHLELKNHIRPQVESQPFLMANYGQYLQKTIELKDLGWRT